MPRYISEITVPNNIGAIRDFIAAFLKKEYYRDFNYNGEDVWIEGGYVFYPGRHIKTTVTEGKVKIESWLRYSIYPGIYLSKEWDFTNPEGFAQVLVERVIRLEEMLTALNEPHTKFILENGGGRYVKRGHLFCFNCFKFLAKDVIEEQAKETVTLHQTERPGHRTRFFSRNGCFVADNKQIEEYLREHPDSEIASKMLQPDFSHKEVIEADE